MTDTTSTPESKATLAATAPLEVIARLRTFEEWQAWCSQRPYLFSPDYRERILARVRQDGIVDPLTGTVTAGDAVVIAHDNYRETVKGGRLIARHRALLDELKQLAIGPLARLVTRQCRIYAPEALTDFALYMRGIFPRFLGSEYAADNVQLDAQFPIPSEDLLGLTFPSGSFDLTVSNDGFEHVSDLDRALAECARILRPDGVLIATFPFAFNHATGVVKAGTSVKRVEQPTPRDHHGDTMEANQRSLDFKVPGWDVVERARAAGFADAYFAVRASADLGLLSRDINALFVFVALKQVLPAGVGPHGASTTQVAPANATEAKATASTAEVTSAAFAAAAPSPRAAPGQTALSAPATSAMDRFPREVAALVGLPRSGTTVFSAAVGAHPGVKTVYEPWNGEKKQLPPTDLGVAAFVERFKVRPEPGQHLLFVKETGAEPMYLQAIDNLLTDARARGPAKLIWIYRDPLHAFLSEMNARREWWGEPDLEIGQQAFDKWAERSLDALARLRMLTLRHDALCVEYEGFVRDPGACLARVMPFLNLEYHPAQLEYFLSLDRREVRGDLNVHRAPQAISPESVARRASELEIIRPLISRSALYPAISGVEQIARETLGGHAPDAVATGLFLERLAALLATTK